jgi:hypothetical protein
VLDLEVEIEGLPRDMSTSIKQYQVVGMWPPQKPCAAKILHAMNLDAVTAQDASAHVATALMRIDEENLLVIENRAAPKWLVHTAPTKLTPLCQS